MNCNLLSALCAFAFVLVSGPALADDASPPADANGPYTWSGWHVGVNTGGSWRSGGTSVSASPSNIRFTSCCYIGLSSAISPSGFGSGGSGWVGGAEVGYDRQFGAMVLGVEADLEISGPSRSVEFQAPTTANSFFGPSSAGSPANSTVSAEMDWLTTYRARAGVAPVERALLYVTGGLAVGHVHTSVVTNFGGSPPFNWAGSNDSVRGGWTLGGGGEYALTNHITLRGEYLYYDLGGQTVTGNPSPGPYSQFLSPYMTASPHYSGSVARAGVDYKF